MGDLATQAVVITGLAYGRRATLEISGDTLTWRARRGTFSSGPSVPENIVTTVHDVRFARWLELPWSYAGTATLALGVALALTGAPLGGAIAAAAGLALLVWRRTHPRQFLILDVGDRRLVLRVALPSAAPARSLAERVDRALASGEAPLSPPTLP
ncbi:MAG: hypothetical protein KIT31_29450 [Deltaproteobacteria bacterium]|nr:hypothetical protein [Deltaproteobacteria bacterium]